MPLFPASLKNRLTLMFASLSLLIWLPLYFYIEHFYAGQLVENRRKSLQALASAVATVVSENLHERQRNIAILATSVQQYIDQPEGISKLGELLDQLKTSYDYYSWIGFADTQGMVQAANSQLLVGQNVQQRPWYQQGLKGSFVGDLHEAVLLSKLLPNPDKAPIRFIDFALPVYGKDQKLLGVVAAHAHWSWAEAIMQAIAPIRQNLKQLEIRILDQRLHSIYPEYGKEPFKPEDLKHNLSQVLMSLSDQRDHLVALQPVPEPNNLQAAPTLGWKILVCQPLEVVRYEADQLRRLLLLFGLIATLVFLVLTHWASGLISQPIERLARIARRIQQGDESLTALPSEGPTEIRFLNTAIRSMALTLIERRLEVQHMNEFLEERIHQRTQELSSANQALEQLARKDPLTGCLNRLAAREQLGEAFQRLQKHHQTYSLLVLDIDHFKRINDNFGHALGDQALQFVAQLICQSLRQNDRVFRMGGEEFMVLLPHAHISTAEFIGERIRAGIAHSPHPEVGQITVSIGTSEAKREDSNEEQAMHRADEALYAAKASGRNNVQIR